MADSHKTIVIALGGNAILSEGEYGTVEQQMLNMEGGLPSIDAPDPV
ncbi:MAG TPA: carbamate kinase, partial [Dehalococcoidia bacterium]|nr:carbamate kinase [Dehalococcoidia bacterium]